MAQKIQYNSGLVLKKMNTPEIIYEFPLLIRTALRAFFSSHHYLNWKVKMPIYPGYVCVGQSQDPLPVGSVDEEAIWLGDGRDVGP